MGKVDDFPGDETVGCPVLLDEWHMRGEVVGHVEGVECGRGGHGIEEGGCYCHGERRR